MYTWIWYVKQWNRQQYMIVIGIKIFRTRKIHQFVTHKKYAPFFRLDFIKFIKQLFPYFIKMFRGEFLGRVVLKFKFKALLNLYRTSIYHVQFCSCSSNTWGPCSSFYNGRNASYIFSETIFFVSAYCSFLCKHITE